MNAQGFPKQERIVSRKLIDDLFSGGQSLALTAFPLRLVYKLVPSVTLHSSFTSEAPPSLQLLISVSKRRFKHAVDRNRVKRQLREAFRKNKQLLAPAVPEGQMLAIAFVWLSDSHLPTAEIERRTKNALQRIAQKLQQTPPPQL